MTRPSPKRPNPPLKCQDFTLPTKADWFMLQSTRRSNKSYPHEVAAADLFVHYYPYLDSWIHEPKFRNYKDVEPDRGMQLGGKTVFFEVDCDTEFPNIIEKKIKAYIQYGRETGTRFYVIFDLVGTDVAAINKRAKMMGELFETYRRGNQFAVASHYYLMANAFDAAVIFTPLGTYRLADL